MGARVSLLIRFSLFALTLVVGMVLGFELKLHREQLSVLWPPVGILAGVIATSSGRISVAYIAIFALIDVFFPIALGMEITLAINGPMLVANILAAYGTGWFARRVAGCPTDLGVLNTMGAFIAGALVMGTFTGFLTGIVYGHGGFAWGFGLKWALDVFLSCVTLGPLIATLAHAYGKPWGGVRVRDIAMFGTFVVLGLFATGHPQTAVSRVVNSIHVVLPFFVCALLFGGSTVVRAGVLVTTVLMTLELDGGAGPFAQRLTEGERLATLQAFIAFGGSVTMLADAAISHARAVSLSLAREARARKVTLEQLIEERKRIAQVTGRSGVTLFLFDLVSKKFLFVSDGYEELFGRKRAALFVNPRDWREAVHPEDRKALPALVSEHSTVANLRMRIGDEHAFRTLLVHIDGVCDKEGKVTRLAGIATEITQVTSLEEESKILRDALAQAQRQEVVGKIAAGVAHDLNNIYTVMQNTLTVGLRVHKTIPPEFHDAMKAATGLTRGLLSLGRPKPEAAYDVAIRKVIEVTVSMIRPTLRDSEIKMDTSIDAGMSVLGDEGELQQMIMNLVFNARDAGANTIKLSARYEDAYVVLSVADDGPGIAPENLPKVFEAFFSTKGAYGHGLGLSISRHLAEARGGSIGVESSPKGTTFSIRLPASRVSSHNRGTSLSA
jgi:signal transduction histidine kinase